ncbi:hypothetical protein LTR56_001940 [Elasticomyces elasticus]|nr:hypothetical protein LTR22_024796 [Elasticomyces elasticus]KAK3658084.1 hypothetical protein LTR56_001940 [Elasticomyces elasticus]KAK4923548.1 hypothetical protein LTR49_009261 [Elasticomyces elasticus]KAK5749774.1 hypothetical protein LTS12_020134 [Elasticomyces elasticus]
MGPPGLLHSDLRTSLPTAADATVGTEKLADQAILALVILALLAYCIRICLRRHRKQQIAPVGIEKLANQLIFMTAPGRATPTTVVTTTDSDSGRGWAVALRRVEATSSSLQRLEVSRRAQSTVVAR